MKNKLPLLILIITLFSCNKNEKAKVAEPVVNKEITVKDSSKSEQTEKPADSITCVDVVLEILTTAPSYIEGTKGLYEAVVKNGGTSIGITVEGSPNPKIDKSWSYSETYDLSLHETYPDRMPTIARYVFDPSKRELFEYNTANDSLIAIDFNKDLLLKFDKICK
ncbi:hypothetical protein HYN56_04565 [Flavobacterium crocinum]|uniref:Lipoprotein n=1 Tax=Flavobacterium crocinum TaxID=2183896 RepID=A0A2S1YHJ9_9FLAO|nr:hypothetical protein [Flavobacterium crocinum]AWK03533.1 hypothetical protein HYN56_04565 [Flavobacterium crocinum]